MNIGGYIRENWHWKDPSFEKSFGEVKVETMKPLGRKQELEKLKLPTISQDDRNDCVACSVTFIKQYEEKTGLPLSKDWLVEASGTKANGAKPSWVWETARLLGIASKTAPTDKIGQNLDAQKHKIKDYFYLENPNPKTIYAALKKGPVAVGIKNWMGGSLGHYVVIVDRNESGDWDIANWNNDVTQEYGTLPIYTEFDEAVVCAEVEGVSRLGFINWLIKTLPFLLSFRSIKAASVIGGLLLSGLLGSQMYGSLSLPGKYRTTLSQDISTTETFIPVSSITLKTGEVLGAAGSPSIQFPVYLTVGDGMTQEDVECNSLNTSTLRWTNCTGRGLSLYGGASTSSVSGKAFPHSSGETVIISTTPYSFNRFVDIFSDQSVTGTKTFTADRTNFTGNQIRVGDSSTSTCEFIYLPTGQPNPGYLKMCGPIAGNTTSTLYFSLDGTNDLQLNASGTTVGASSTNGVVLVNGLFAVNASSTPSTNGGFMIFNSLGQLAWDINSFLTGAARRFTSLFADSLDATTTAQTLHISGSPTSPTDAVNKGYADYLESLNMATGTAGMTIAPGNALYISSTNTLFLADADATSTSYQFVGIALNSATTTNQVSYAKPGGIATVSGLTAGKFYYLSGTAGSLVSAPAAIPARVGIAVSSTALLIQSPSFRARKSGAVTGFNGSEATTVTGFQPTRIELWCERDGTQTSGSQGYWALNSDGTSSTASVGTDDDTAPYEKSSITSACLWEEGTTDNLAYITVTHTGFIINTLGGASRSLQYVAEFDPDFLR